MAKRRERGEGSIFHDETKDLWVGVLSLGVKPDGKRDRRTVYAKSKPEVVAELRTLREMASKAPVIEGAGQSLRDYLIFWLAAIKTAGCKLRTHEAYERTAMKHVIPVLGSVRLCDLTAYHAHQLFEAMAKKGASAFTQRYAHKVLRSSLSYAVKPLQALPANPMFGVKAPQHIKKKLTTWTSEQCGSFLTAAAKHKYYIGYLLLTDLGIREGELLALHWTDFDLPAGTVHIQATIQSYHGKMLGRGPPKTQQSDRIITLTPRVVAGLRQHRARLMERGLAACPWVIPSRAGTPINLSNFGRVYREFVRSLDLPYVRPHDIRHSHATILIQAGVDTKTAADRMGHSVTTLMQTYVHSNLTQQRKASEQFSAVMDGK